MIPEFSKIINEINIELAPEYQMGAWNWIEKKYQGEFSRCSKRFESSIIEWETHKNLQFIEREAKLYKETMVNWFKEYKKNNEVDDTTSFLRSIGKKYEE